MAADFPTSVKTFTTKSNNVDTIDASHVNDLQDEVNAVETLLGAGSKSRTTWTPTFVWSGGGGTFTYSTQAGLYTRLGGVVYIATRIALSAVSTVGASGNLTIASLPFTVLNSGTNQLAIAGLAANWTTNTPAMAAFNLNATSMTLYSGPLLSQTIGTGNITATSSIFVSGFYFI